MHVEKLDLDDDFIAAPVGIRLQRAYKYSTVSHPAARKAKISSSAPTGTGKLRQFFLAACLPIFY